MTRERQPGNIVYSLHPLSLAQETPPPAIFGIYRKDQLFYICHSEGIDLVPVDSLFSLLSQSSYGSLDVFSSIELPNTTSIAILDSVFKNPLYFVAQWNPEEQSSKIKLLTGQNSLLNEWTLQTPLYGLALSHGTEHHYQLMAGAGKLGTHVFNINLSLPTFHPNFLQRISTLAPESHHATTGIFVYEQRLYTIDQFENNSQIQVQRIPALLEQAQALREQTLDNATSFGFQTEQKAKALFNGLIASIPFDADRLVDVIGFDLEADLEQQLADHDLLDVLTPEEIQAFQKSIEQYQTTGELIGVSAQVLAAIGKTVQLKKLQKIKIEKNIQDLNAIRQGLGIAEQSALTSRTPWLSGWQAEELALADFSVTVQKRLSALRLAHEGALPHETALKIIREMEKRKTFIRPLERVLTTQGYTHIHALEGWTFERLRKFFEGTRVTKGEGLIPFQGMAFSDLSTFCPEALSHYRRYAFLHSLENLTPLQKLELLQVQTRVKFELLKLFQRVPGTSLPMTAPSRRALEWLKTKAKFSDLGPLMEETETLSNFLRASEESLGLTQLLALEKLGANLTHFQKLEKLKLMLKAGWKGKCGTALVPNVWPTAELAQKEASLIDTLDRIYAFEYLRQSGHVSRLFKNGKLKEALFFTLLSDAANIGTEYATRSLDGRPFFSTGLAHNLIFNTYIMIPIFATRGLRLSPQGKLFLLLFNATSTGYLTQKMTKWGGEMVNAQQVLEKYYHDEDFTLTDLVPPPRMPLIEIPKYIYQDTLTPDASFNGSRALFDSSWTLFLSTPRGIFVSWLSNHWASSALLDKDGLGPLLLRETTRSAPVTVNELVGAATYPPIYGRVFEENELKLSVIDARLETQNTWDDETWSLPPALKFSLWVNSSTPPAGVHFTLRQGESSENITLNAHAWKEVREQEYRLEWTQILPPEEKSQFFSIENISFSNDARFVGNPLQFWDGKEYQAGQQYHHPVSLTATLPARDDFFQGFIKAWASLAKDAKENFLNHHELKAAGMMYAIGRYLELFFVERVNPEKSHSLAIDILKQALTLTKSIRLTQTPIDLESLTHLIEMLETLSNMLPEEALSIKTLSPQTPELWLSEKSVFILEDVETDILSETNHNWLFLDQGNKNDWRTLQFYKGFAYGLSKLFRWYRYHIYQPSDTSTTYWRLLIRLTDEISQTGSEFETSWLSSLSWNDAYLEKFALKFSLLKQEITSLSK